MRVDTFQGCLRQDTSWVKRNSSRQWRRYFPQLLNSVLLELEKVLLISRPRFIQQKNGWTNYKCLVIQVTFSTPAWVHMYKSFQRLAGAIKSINLKRDFLLFVNCECLFTVNEIVLFMLIYTHRSTRDQSNGPCGLGVGVVELCQLSALKSVINYLLHVHCAYIYYSFSILFLMCLI